MHPELWPYLLLHISHCENMLLSQVRPVVLSALMAGYRKYLTGTLCAPLFASHGHCTREVPVQLGHGHPTYSAGHKDSIISVLSRVHMRGDTLTPSIAGGPG
jgi:hypothetical protein